MMQSKPMSTTLGEEAHGLGVLLYHRMLNDLGEPPQQPISLQQRLATLPDKSLFHRYGPLSIAEMRSEFHRRIQTLELFATHLDQLTPPSASLGAPGAGAGGISRIDTLKQFAAAKSLQKDAESMLLKLESICCCPLSTQQQQQQQQQHNSNDHDHSKM